MWLKSSLFNQSHLFKIKIKDRGVLNFSFLTIQAFCVFMCEDKRGYVLKFI